MESRFGPVIRRRLLGRKLRELREAAGKKMADAANYTDLKIPTISRIETGKQAILSRNVRVLCQLYDVGAPMVDTLVRLAEEAGERTWYSLYSDVVPNWVEWFLGLESEADEIWSYEAELVPGLLQTPAYIRAVAAAAQLDSTDVELERSVELRLARQRRLTAAEPPQLRAVLSEAVLRRVVGGPQVMAEQVRHLLDMNLRDNITIQVLPFSVGAHCAMTGSFTMLRFPDELEMNAVFLEHDHGATSLERPVDLTRYGRMFGEVARVALSQEASCELLVSLGSE